MTSNLPPNLQKIAIVAIASGILYLIAPELIKSMLRQPEANTSAESSEQELIQKGITVRDENTKKYLSDVKVSFSTQGPIASKLTDSNGYVQIEIPKRNDIKVSIEKEGYESLDLIIDLQKDQSYNIEINMKPEADSSSNRSASDANFAGDWQAAPSFTGSFTLMLKQNGNQILGHHIAVAQAGNRVDASLPNKDSPTIYGITHGNVAKVTFNSTHGGRGNATLQLESENRLTWAINSDNGEFYFLPRGGMGGPLPMYRVISNQIE